MMKRWIAVAVFALFVAGKVGAQSPNLEAHRLYFVAVSSWIDKDADTAAQAIRSYLNTAGVAESEHGAAFQALAKFKRNYAVLTEGYNNMPETLAGTNGYTDAFVSHRDMLVQDTIEELRATLSAKSFENLTERVRHDSLNIRSSPPESTAKRSHGAKLIPVLGNMTGHYSGSTSSSLWVDANGKYYYYDTPVVDGYTTCSSPCSTVTHQGVVTNTLGGGGTVYGPKVTPTSNISVSNQGMTTYNPDCFDLDLPQPQPDCGDGFWQEEGMVSCSVFGNFFGWGKYFFVVEPAITFSQVTGWLNANTATLQEWCLLPYIPPDYNPGLLTHAASGAQYAIGGALCINSTLNSGTWLCTPGLAYSLIGVYTRKWCTHNPPPY